MVDVSMDTEFAQLKAAEEDAMAAEARVAEIRRSLPRRTVPDYVFATVDGEVRLSELFGEADDLLVVLNMGSTCPACTMWGDGFNGTLEHITSRTPFVISSPDAPKRQREFAAERGWKLTMVSHQGTSFAADMGFNTDDGYMPGIASFRRSGDEIELVTTAEFGPGDMYSPVFNLFALLAGGDAGWEPKLSYR